MSTVAVRKVILQFPDSLLDRADHLAVELHTNRSSLIRTAVEEKLNRVEQERLEGLLKTGYIQMAQQRVSDHAEFEHLATDLLSRGV